MTVGIYMYVFVGVVCGDIYLHLHIYLFISIYKYLQVYVRIIYVHYMKFFKSKLKVSLKFNLKQNLILIF